MMLSAPVLAFPDLVKPSLFNRMRAKLEVELFCTNLMNWVESMLSMRVGCSQRHSSYSTTEREMLALILAVRKWKPFLSHKIYAETDHKPLVGTWTCRIHLVKSQDGRRN